MRSQVLFRPLAARILGVGLALVVCAHAGAHNEHPLGREQIAWDVNPVVLRTLAYNFDFAGGGDFVTWRPPGGVEARHGRECLVGPYFFFDIDDRFAFDIDETVTLALTFDTEITAGFNLSYDHAVTPTVVSRDLSTQGSESLLTVAVELPRARFANRKYGKTDFAIGGRNSLFPADNTGGGHRIALCGIEVRRAADRAPREDDSDVGRFELTVADAEGKPDRRSRRSLRV